MKEAFLSMCISTLVCEISMNLNIQVRENRDSPSTTHSSNIRVNPSKNCYPNIRRKPAVFEANHFEPKIAALTHRLKLVTKIYAFGQPDFGPAC